jgi:hypothetical protein
MCIHKYTFKNTHIKINIYKYMYTCIIPTHVLHTHVSYLYVRYTHTHAFKIYTVIHMITIAVFAWPVDPWGLHLRNYK